MTQESAAARRKMHRSPNYPFLSLAEAIQRLGKVYQEEKRSPASGDVIIRHLGYDPKSGPGLRSLSALRQYGMLEDRGNGQYRVSDLGFTLLHFPEESSERRAALVEALWKPALFNELLRHYNGQLPSDANLTSYLLRERAFNPATVPQFIKTFRESVSLVGDGGMSYDGNETEQELHNMPVESTQDIAFKGTTTAIGQQQNRSIPQSASQTYSFALSIPRNVKAELRIFGDVTAEDIKRLKKQVEFLEEQFEEGS